MSPTKYIQNLNVNQSWMFLPKKNLQNAVCVPKIYLLLLVWEPIRWCTDDSNRYPNCDSSGLKRIWCRLRFIRFLWNTMSYHTCDSRSTTLPNYLSFSTEKNIMANLKQKKYIVLKSVDKCPNFTTNWYDKEICSSLQINMAFKPVNSTLNLDFS